MKLRSTLFLLIVVLGLGAYLYFFERNSATTREAQDHVVNVDRDKIDAISLRSPENKIELRKSSAGIWSMEEPAKDRADSVAVSELLTAIDTLKPESTIPVDVKNDKELLKEYGVIDATTKVKLSGSAKPVEIVLGKDTAVEGRSYVYIDGGKNVYAVPNSLKTQLQKKADDFRDRSLADFGPDAVTKAEIKSVAGVLELAKVNNHWTITKPLQARGDDAKIRDLLASTLKARVDTFGSEANQATSGLSEPRGTVTFTREGVEKPIILSIGQNPKEEKDKEKTWAKLSTRDAIVLVPKAIEKVLETKPNDVRDRNLLRVESDIVDRITVEPAGAAKFVMARKGESWVGKTADNKEQTINESVPPKILSELQNAQIIEFVSDVATDLPKYGLDQPQLKVTLSSFASENTPETNAGEKPIVTVLIGKLEDTRLYAKLDNEPFVVAVSTALLNQLPSSTIALQDLTIFNDKPDDVTALEVTQSTQALSLEKDKDGSWKLTKGDGKVDQSAVSGLINGLARLRAIRWVGPTKSDEGIDKPAVVITATLTTGGKTSTRKLTIGNPASDLWNATAEGKEGTFQIGKPDHDLFVAPLTDQPAPAPAAASGTTPVPAPVPATPEPKPGTPGAPAAPGAGNAPPIPGITNPANLSTPLGQPPGTPPIIPAQPAPPATPPPPAAPVPPAASAAPVEAPAK